MITSTEVKKGAFGRPVKSDTPVKTLKQAPKKFYIFKLLEEQHLSKPVDPKTNQLAGDPYPALYIAPNAGIAVNPESGVTEKWRYLHGYNSIWEKDQQEPVPSKERLGNIDGKNDLIFRTGKLQIRGNETAKFEALVVQDIYDGIGDKQVVPLPFKYTLVDPSKEQTLVRNEADRAFEAESAARKADTAEMLAVADALGIDVQNSDLDEDAIRTKFILKAKQNAELFLRVFNDPRNRVKYLVTKYMQSGNITVDEGVLSYEGVPYASVRVDADVSMQIATMTIEGDEKCKKLYDILKSL